MNGAILETYVISEVVKSYLHNGLPVNIFFYRDKDKNEIDLLINRNGMLFPVEIKRSASPKTSDVKQFKYLSTFELPVGNGAIICLYDKLLPLNSQTMIVPVCYL